MPLTPSLSPKEERDNRAETLSKKIQGTLKIFRAIIIFLNYNGVEIGKRTKLFYNF
jgi:hypothetical protein